MLFLAGLLLHLLAFGSLVAPVFSFQFNFAIAQQCAPILLSFSGLTSTVSGPPVSLTIIPSNSTAIVVPLQNNSFSAGIGLNLPFAAGSQFLASLDDASGSNIINISDIMPVLPSPDNNSTCVLQPDQDLPRPFVLASPVVSQCQDFTVNYDTTMVSQAPSIRLYSPNGPSFFLNATSDDPLSGVATYTMAFSYGREVVLLMDDGQGMNETTAFLVVGGNSSSSQACLSAQSTGTVSGDTSTSAGISYYSSQVIAITGAAAGGVAVLLGICVAIFVLRNHQRRRRAQHTHSDKTIEKGSHNEKGRRRQLPVIVLNDPGFLTNLLKTSKGFLSSKKAVYGRSSLASWSQAIPEDQDHAPSPEAKQSPSLADRLSEDIERMLNLAALQPKSILNGQNPVDFGLPMIPQPALQSPMIFRSPSGRHLRAPPDVPADLNSRTFSTYSTVSANPVRGYSSLSVTESSSLRTPTPSSAHGRSISGGFGLPSSPRDSPALATNVRRVTSKRSNTSIQEWHGGIAR